MTRFTFREFRRCVRAIFAFGAGYKLGEGYELGKYEEARGKSADAEAWQLGYNLAVKRNPYKTLSVPGAKYEALSVRVAESIGPDGLTDAQRQIDPNPDHWKHPQGAPVDDSKDTQIP